MLCMQNSIDSVVMAQVAVSALHIFQVVRCMHSLSTDLQVKQHGTRCECMTPANTNKCPTCVSLGTNDDSGCMTCGTCGSRAELLRTYMICVDLLNISSQAEHTKEAGVPRLVSNTMIAHVLDHTALQAFHPSAHSVMLQLPFSNGTSNCVASLIHRKLHTGSAAAQQLLQKSQRKCSP